MRGLRRGFPAVAAVVTVLAGCGAGKEAPKAPPPRAVEVLTLKPAEVRETSEYLGSLLSRESVLVMPQVAGYVRKIHIKPGQKVDAGAPLVEIDARVETAALDSARAQVESARSRLELAKQSRARAEALFREGLASSEEIERTRADVDAAEAAARAAAAQVSQRQVELQYHVIRAAVPGVTGDVLVRVGAFVNPNTQLTSITQAGVLELTVAIPAARAREVQPNTPVEILDDSGKVLVKSQIFFVAPEADPRTQLVEVKAVFDNSVGLRASELVRARIVYSTRQALEVPALAITRQSGQPFVFAVIERDGKTIVERKPITLGALGERAFVVESGLQPGERIAVSSIQMLRDGAPVTVKAPVAEAGTTTATIGAR